MSLALASTFVAVVASWFNKFGGLSSRPSSVCVNPPLLTEPYVPPYQILLDTPKIQHIREEGFATTDDGVKLWYGLSGLASSPDPPVLFLHGGLSSSDYFGYQINCLADKYSIISIDSRGHGRSFDGPGDLTYDRLTLDTLQVLKHLGIPKVSVVGWSDGAIIGLNLALNNAAYVDRVFAFGGTFNVANGNHSAEENAVVKKFFERSFSEYSTLSPTPDHLDTFSKKVFTMFATLPQWTEETLRRIPTLYDNPRGPLIFVVGAEEEEVVNRDVPFSIRDNIPGSQLIILPGVSHFAFIQDPATFNAAVERFLTYH